MALQDRSRGAILCSARPMMRADTTRAIRRISMLDLIMLALGLAFFAAAVGYTYACERL